MKILDFIIFLVESRRAVIADIKRLYSNHPPFDIDGDRLIRALLHALEPIIIGAGRGYRGNTRYNLVLNKFLGPPRAGTVGVNSTTAILSPAAVIRAVGTPGPYVHRPNKSAPRDLRLERRAYTDVLRDGGASVLVIDETVPGRGRIVQVYLPYWYHDAAWPNFAPSPETIQGLRALPRSSEAILRLVPPNLGPNDFVPPVHGSPLAICFFARWRLVLTIFQRETRRDFDLEWTRQIVTPAAVVHVVKVLGQYAGTADVNAVRLPSKVLGSDVRLGDMKPMPVKAKRVEYVETVTGVAGFFRRHASPPHPASRTGCNGRRTSA